MSMTKLNSYGVRIANGQRYLQVHMGQTRYSYSENEFYNVTSDLPVTQKQAATFAQQADNAGLTYYTTEGVVCWKRMAVMVEVGK